MAQPYHNSNCFHELNHIEDQHHYHLFNYKPDHQTSSSLSCPVFVNDHIDQVQRESYFREPPPPQHFQFQLQADHQMVPCGGSCDLLSSTAHHENQISDHHDSLKLNIWKSSDHESEITNDDTHENILMNSTKWMSSKMRIMKKMMNGPDQTNSDMPVNYTHKQYPTSPLAADQSNNSSSTTTNINKNNTTPIRVCSDCNTTKTPLWRSGPRGPKSLCNACGIRQRKARRAMAAAASGSILEVNKPSKKGRSSSVQKKEKKPKNNNNNNTSCLPFKKRCKLNSPSRGRKKKQIGSNFEELSIRISKNISAYQLSVFPQDEKEAAILLMALSYGLVNG